ncbi:MAG TPA: hypothetical protein VLA52_05175, partial [Thermohalobaculum sp.]|nr:hypothetical protein [Thermohalobaculum sp.]
MASVVRLISLLILAALLTLYTQPGWAGMKEDCLQEHDPKLRLVGCTSIIDSGRWQAAALAPAYYYRGNAYVSL